MVRLPGRSCPHRGRRRAAGRSRRPGAGRTPRAQGRVRAWSTRRSGGCARSGTARCGPGPRVDDAALLLELAHDLGHIQGVVEDHRVREQGVELRDVVDKDALAEHPRGPPVRSQSGAQGVQHLGRIAEVEAQIPGKVVMGPAGTTTSNRPVSAATAATANRVPSPPSTPKHLCPLLNGVLRKRRRVPFNAGRPDLGPPSSRPAAPGRNEPPSPPNADSSRSPSGHASERQPSPHPLSAVRLAFGSSAEVRHCAPHERGARVCAAIDAGV